MSALLEYLNLLPKGLANAPAVLDGIVNKVKMNFGHLDNDEKEEIIRRQVICKSCPFMSVNAANDPAQNYQSSRVDEHCTLCGCNIDLKTSSLLSNCGIEIYNQSEKGKQVPLELKWKVYQKTNPNGI